MQTENGLSMEKNQEATRNQTQVSGLSSSHHGSTLTTELQPPMATIVSSTFRTVECYCYTVVSHPTGIRLSVTVCAIKTPLLLTGNNSPFGEEPKKCMAIWLSILTSLAS